MLAYQAPQLSKATTENTLSLLRIVILATIAGAAVSARLFAVIRFESIIHEFDPWFNYRATRVLVEQGFYEFWNWFDNTAWYPLGRTVGGTLYPGLMITSGVIHNIFHALGMPVNIRDVCVMLAPAFSGLTAIVTYLLAKHLGRRNDGTGGEATGMWAALFVAIAPGYISRSVAGSYDNEAIAIFILMTTFYLWLRALDQGSALFGGLTALFYYYMVAAWGGYAFITNMLPLHAFILILMGRYSPRLYVAYSSYYAIGTLASMQVPFVGFNPIRTSEHMPAMGIFGLLQLIAFADSIQGLVNKRQFKNILSFGVVAVAILAFFGLIALSMAGVIAPWTGRFYSLWDTGYAKIHLPLIASVSEHQPTAWPSFFFDLNILTFLFPAGVFLCFSDLRDEHVFAIVYAVMASYFSGVMVRLMLTLTPIVCVAASLPVAKLYSTYLDPQEPTTASVDTNGSPEKSPSSKKKKSTSTKSSSSSSSSVTTGIWGLDTRAIVVAAFTFMMAMFCLHCTYVTSTAYSSPSVVLASRKANGEHAVIDDFREAYYWLRENTPTDSKVMSWWDYGYQIAGFSQRTTLVDNNTWNNTHIATVGKAMASREEVSYPILKKHDVDYVLVIFGGLIGFSGDDINKFLWMIRISEGLWPDEVHESAFFTPKGEYKLDEEATPTMKNSLMYKMSYYRFNELFGGTQPMDRVRNQRIPMEGTKLDSLEEAFTSENWLVRIYKVKKEDPLSRDHPSANSFKDGQFRKSIAAATSARRT